MTEAIIVALISGGVSLIGSIISAAWTKNLIIYRIEQLEKKQDKHNEMYDRVIRTEESVKSAHHRIDALERAV